MWDRRKCDNTGGCHLLVPYWGRCATYHHDCFGWPFDAVESAIGKGSTSDLAEVLAAWDNWAYDSADHALSFECSGSTVARYALPKGGALRKVVATIWQTKTPALKPEEASDWAGLQIHK